jgi:hypothetical protein
MLAGPARLCRPCRLAGPAHAAATAGFSIQEGKIPRETDCLLEGNGFELPVPRPVSNGFEALSETGTPCQAPLHGQPRRDEAAGYIAGRIGASDLKRVVSQADVAEMIPTENRQMRPSCGLDLLQCINELRPIRGGVALRC